MSEPKRLRVVIAEVTADGPVHKAFAIDPSVDIAGVVDDGLRVVELTRRLRPDVVVIDARVSRISALEATRRIMTESPTPIVLVADGDDRNALQLSIEALQAGALATTRMPTRGTAEFDERSIALVRIVRAMAGLKLVRRWQDRTLPEAAAAPPVAEGRSRRPSIIAIGASTGGPAALHRILSGISEACAVPILVTQHISPGFVHGMVRWLDESTPLKVKVAEHGEPLCAGTVFVADDNRHLTVSRHHSVALTNDELVEGHRPSASVLFRSVAEVFGPKALSVILTGMGCDGSAGLAVVRSVGGCVIAQDEESSAVFGMPRAAIVARLADLVLPLEEIGDYLMSAVAVPQE